MNQPTEKISQPSEGPSSTIFLADAPFLRYLWEEWRRVGLPRATIRPLIRYMTLGRADLLEGTQTDSEIDTDDNDPSETADQTYSEPWNAVKTYQWLGYYPTLSFERP